MEDKGFFVTFHRGYVLTLLEKPIPDSALVIGFREVTLYKLQGKIVQDLVHNSDNLCELWNKSLGHLHYRDFPIMRGIFTGL